MDVDFNGGVSSLDAKLLQQAEVSPLAIKTNPFVAEKLFDQWLSLPETKVLVKSLLNKGVGPLNVSGTTLAQMLEQAIPCPQCFLQAVRHHSLLEVHNTSAHLVMCEECVTAHLYVDQGLFL